MKTGNKKQAIVLSAIALLAVAFLVYQLMPAKGTPFSAAPTPAASSSGTPSPSQDLSLAVMGNPFSHPKLASKVVSEMPSPQPKASIDKSGSVPLKPSGLPNPEDVDRSTPQGGTSGGSTPEDIAGNNRLKVQGPRIKLTAIMRVGEAVAMLEVNDQPEKTFVEGDRLAPNASLVKIGDSSITVLINGMKHEIATGDTYGSSEEKRK